MTRIDKNIKDIAQLNKRLGDLFAELVQIKSRLDDLEDDIVVLKEKEQP